MRLIALIMDTVSTYKTSVRFYQTTRRNVSEDSHLHTRRRENLKSNHVHVSSLLVSQERVAVVVPNLLANHPFFSNYELTKR
jgi:hypothetical protein